MANPGLQQTVLDLQATNAVLEAELAERGAELMQIRALMHQVTVYEGLVDASNLVMMVADLVRDHDALETRIENVLHYCADEQAGSPENDDVVAMCLSIIDLARGGSPVPDDLSGLDG